MRASAVLLVLGFATAFVAYKNQEPARPLSRPIKNAGQKTAAIRREHAAEVKAPITVAAESTPRVAEQAMKDTRESNER